MKDPQFKCVTTTSVPRGLSRSSNGGLDRLGSFRFLHVDLDLFGHFGFQHLRGGREHSFSSEASDDRWGRGVDGRWSTTPKHRNKKKQREMWFLFFKLNGQSLLGNYLPVLFVVHLCVFFYCFFQKSSTYIIRWGVRDGDIIIFALDIFNIFKTHQQKLSTNRKALHPSQTPQD